MITRPNGLLAVLAAGAFSLLVSACEKVPLQAPTGSTIILTAATNSLPANGSTDIIAHVLEAAGTPPHSGTLVTFTATIGVVEPSEARTDVGGRAVVKFRASGQNGTATVVASSGAASTGTDGAVKIAIGTAAVGSVRLGANPTTVSANGGVATLTAGVVDVNGNALASVPVNFSTTAGTLGSTLINTDANGVAQTTLTTSVQATVTATVGVQAPPATGGTGGTGTGGTTSGQASATVTINVNPLATVSISPPSGTLTVGSPVVFTIVVSVPASSTAQIREVVVNFGDGDSVNLGAVNGTTSVQHNYDDDDTYTVTVRATDTLGSVTSSGTVIVVQPQTPKVTIDSRKFGAAGLDFEFKGNVIPSDTTVVSYFWNFGDGETRTTTLSTTTKSYPVGSTTKQVSLTITTPSGQQASSSISVTPGP